jgi:hypothetical protein
MREKEENDEIRWQVVKAMLDEFPTLREKVKVYIEEQKKKQRPKSFKCGFFSKGVVVEP